MSEEILAMLSNLGALNVERAASIELISKSERLRGVDIAAEIATFEEKGYVKRFGEKIYLTEAGLIRALSMIS
ncbi:MAG: hypothetical protein JRN52_11835 [Nitrososphaerota archaeon]|nr:hypothetical protein [Nitrososphaerota archaeon]